MSNNHYAYGDERADVEAVMRLHAVKRWHMIDTTRIQTLAEHTGNVALLAFAIAKTCPMMYFGPATHVAGLAAIHDLPEVFTGDIPSHTKGLLQGIEDLESSVLPACFIERITADEKRLIKICDLADGIRFIRIHGSDMTAAHARQQLEVKFQKIRDGTVGLWPQPVHRHVHAYAWFYAYERS